MILIVGGTGRLGSVVANRLCAQGRDVGVVSRGLVPPAVPLHERVKQIVGDVRDPLRMQELVPGAEMVVLAMQGFAGPGGVSPRTEDQQGSLNVIAAAERSAADVVLLSIAGASATSPLELARVKYGVEEHLRTSRCRWTVVRPDAFAKPGSTCSSRPPASRAGLSSSVRGPTRSAGSTCTRWQPWSSMLCWSPPCAAACWGSLARSA